MSISKKQISLGVLATTLTVITPIATVISCGKNDHVQEVQVIDLEKMESTTQLFSTLNSFLNNFMPEKATEMGLVKGDLLKHDSYKSSFNKIKNYMSEIKTTTKKIVFHYRGATLTWDLSKLNQAIKDVNDSIALGFDEGIIKNFRDFSNIDNPSMAVYIAKQQTPQISPLDKNIQGGMIGVNLMGFTRLPKGGYDAYNRILEEYHKLSWKLINADFFARWIKGKKYLLPTGNLISKSNTSTEEIEPGKKYDDRTNPESGDTFIKSKVYKKEQNNFEAQWVLSIMHMY